MVTRPGLLLDSPPLIPLSRAVLFFDLAGTLVNVDGSLQSDHRDILVGTARKAKGTVLVTGQDSQDPQVRELLSIFEQEEGVSFFAYTTRGGIRLRRSGRAFESDPEYTKETRLNEATSEKTFMAIESLLGVRRLTPLIPIALLDGVAVRVNLPPSERPDFAGDLRAELIKRDISSLQVVIEGRTSIFVTRKGVGKRLAVAFELDRLARRRASKSNMACYFGNEFVQVDGNDREILGLPLEVFAVGGCGNAVPGVQCWPIGEGPEAVYRLLSRSLDAS